MKYVKLIGLLGIPLLIWGLVSTSYGRGYSDGRESYKLDSLKVVVDSIAASSARREKALRDSLAVVESKASVISLRNYALATAKDRLAKKLAQANETADSLDLMTEVVAIQEQQLSALEARDTLRLRYIALQATEIDSLRRDVSQLRSALYEAIRARSRRPTPSTLNYLGLGSCVVAGYGLGRENALIGLVGAAGCGLKAVVAP